MLAGKSELPRRAIYNLPDYRVCVQVALRIRPINEAELEEGASIIAHRVGDQVRLGQGSMGEFTAELVDGSFLERDPGGFNFTLSIVVKNKYNDIVSS